jgi:archaellum biogenesis protein FlaJ (TadC family)
VTEQDHGRRELVREAVTMALYISLSLIAVLVAVPKGDHVDGVVTATTLLLSAVGLVLAHHVAFRLSSRLVDHGLVTPESLRSLGAQMAGALPVAVVASLPPLLLRGSAGTVLSEVLLVGFVAGVGYVAVRQSASRGRSILYVAGLVIAVALVIGLKTAVGH